MWSDFFNAKMDHLESGIQFDTKLFRMRIDIWKSLK